ncbi:phage portal protein [Phyllobacterium salinisoli]|uniref:Phage portal protein n=1 Tax=Phyllobacterium salinisoli TaxID=1899321 RepID=A0A368K192_9HYPH|nr:phage portal protein [Phyllobacterium salinisoli]RCS23147.1 phage portal protein [Phyllobacterium salinisoli]
MKRFGQFSHILASAALALSTVLSVGGLSSTAVKAADFLGNEAVYGETGICSDQRVLKTIVSRFSYQVTHVPNLPMVEISAFSDVHQKRFEPAQRSSEITRHYCAATAMLSDGEHRRVLYLIEEGQGFASFGDNVEFCVAGFDRWNVYDSGCRVLR